MLSNNLSKIILLHPLRINHNLNKGLKRMAEYNKRISENIASGPDSSPAKMEPRVQFTRMTSDSDGDLPDSIGMDGGIDGDEVEWPRRDPNTWNGVPFSIRTQFNNKRKRIIAEAYVRFRLLFIKPLKNPIDLFDEVKANFLEISDEKVDEQEMKQLLTKLELSKQRNVVNQVKNEGKIKSAEVNLYNAGFKQYQTEASLIEFILKCKKGLCLTEIDNFDRVIPDAAADLLSKAEQLAVFDNYLILHYDQNKAKNPFLTEKERPKPKPRDPILFGVIQNSDKFYFIADWIDEFCDLTYKDILKDGKDFKLKKP